MAVAEQGASAPAADVTAQMRELVELVGGASNVATVSHCLTRLRFVLNDPSLADTEKIGKLPSVKGSFNQGGQFQVVIGSEVEDFHKELTALLGDQSAGSKEEAKKAARANMKWWERGISHLAEIFVPLLFAIITGGLILGARNVIGDIKFGDQTLAESSQFWQGTYDFLWLLGEAIFHFLPVGVCWATVKKMGGTEILGIVLGITLVSPQLMNAYAIGQETPKVWDFGFAQIPMVGYQAQVIPAVLAGLTLAFIELRLKKIVPNALYQVVVPFVALVTTVLLAHVVLGPLGRELGDLVGNGAKAMLTGGFAPIGAVIFGFFYAPLVITGIHHTTNAVDLQLMQDIGGTPIWPLIALSNIAQASAVVGMIVVAKRGKTRELAVPAAVSAYLGVTEPAMYGVNLRFKYPMLAAMIGSACAALICGIAGVMANGIGVGGLPGILSIKHEYWAVYSLAMAVAIAVPLALTLVFSRRAAAREALAEAEGASA
ncbi:PTS trehalose transporter subunit IIBC [Streptomyces sp. NBC_01304]|uniref:PTS trehalose transporter subunit IIBC n=1 Tax=Streptomyces sp. NBC_01304 TaxID=2903818 RepID=UPI002E149EE7|nr:PTS trehalose transporter subunit IIBC [Streptomyces sp. NBC_01304]